jgi:hypothetical protein
MKLYLPQRKDLRFALFLVAIEALAWLGCQGWDALHPRYQAVVPFGAMRIEVNGRVFDLTDEVRRVAAAHGVNGWSLHRPLFPEEIGPDDSPRNVYDQVVWWIQGLRRPPFIEDVYEFRMTAGSRSEAERDANDVVLSAVTAIDNAWSDYHRTAPRMSVAEAKRQAELAREAGDEAVQNLNDRWHEENELYSSAPVSFYTEAEALPVQTFKSGWLQTALLLLAACISVSSWKRPSRTGKIVPASDPAVAL